MHPFREPLLAVKKQPQKCRLQKKAENAFHGQRLADHSTGEPREPRPVGAEFKFHWNPSHHAEDEVDAKDATPKSRRAIPLLAARLQRHRLQDHDQQCEAHGELRK